MCVANRGGAPVTNVEVIFAVSQPDATIATLRVPLTPGEMSEKQARAIVSSLPPQQHATVEIVVQASQALQHGAVQVSAPQASLLSDKDVPLECSAQGTPAPRASFEPTYVTLGGEPVTGAVASVDTGPGRPVTPTPDVFQTTGAPTPLNLNAPANSAPSAVQLSMPSDVLSSAIMGLALVIALTGLMVILRRR